MSDYYARPMPALGFDPAPGDVGTMRSLAHRQHAAAGELRQVQKHVQNADLSSWQGQAGSVARPVAVLNDPVEALAKIDWRGRGIGCGPARHGGKDVGRAARDLPG